METVFTKIMHNQIPSVRLHEDELCIAILDISPVNKGHVLVISREPYPTIADCPIETLGHLMSVVKRIDAVLREKLHADATNIVINNGPAAGQEVPHLHIHVIPRHDHDGKRFIPPKEKYGEGELERMGKLLRLD
ncbi:MAG: HIT family protein [Sphaerochaetaceae bacterium]|nr:HIT family protein [Sphaerochaetaceae bacterium]